MELAMRIKREIIFSSRCVPRRVTPRAHAFGHKEPSSCQVWRLGLADATISLDFRRLDTTRGLVCISFFYWSPWLIFSRVLCVSEWPQSAKSPGTRRADALTPVRWFQFIREEFQPFCPPPPLHHFKPSLSYTLRSRPPLFLTLFVLCASAALQLHIIRLEDRLWPRFPVLSLL